MTSLSRKIETDEQDQLIDQIAAIEPGRHWVVSCYIQLNAQARQRNRYLAEVKGQIRLVSDQLQSRLLPDAERRAVLRDLERVAGVVLEPQQVPRSPGVAVFACEALGLFAVIPLAQVRRTRVLVDREPHLRELIGSMQQFGRVLTVVIDRDHARIFQVTAGGATEVPDLTGLALRGGRFHSDPQDSPGWGEKHYHNRITRERERHYEALVRRLRQVEYQHAARGIVIAGGVRDVAGFTRFLDPTLGSRVLGSVRLSPPRVTPTEVQTATLAVCRAADLEQDRTEVARMLEGLGDGWGVNGVQATTRALSRGQLRTLIVNAQSEAAEVDEAIDEALGQHVRVVIVEDQATAARIKHLSGVLRFK